MPITMLVSLGAAGSLSPGALAAGSVSPGVLSLEAGVATLSLAALLPESSSEPHAAAIRLNAVTAANQRSCFTHTPHWCAPTEVLPSTTMRLMLRDTVG